MTSTISRGYDSPAVNVLARECRIGKAYTVRRSNSVIPSWVSREATNDDGTEIATRLGIPVHAFDKPTEDVGPDEVFFLASTTAEPELAFYELMKDADRSEDVTLLLTAYNGGPTWYKKPKAHLIGDQLRRGDTSGLNLAEIRLRSGVINAAVPFIYGRSNSDLHRIANSEAFGEWSVGGEYDKPIARRIVEEAGIPRSWFGTRKRAVVQEYALPHHSDLRVDFFRFLRERCSLSQTGVFWRRILDRVVFLSHRTLERLLALIGIKIKAPPARPLLRGKYDLSYFLHIWAVERLTKRYANIISAAQEPGKNP